MPSIFFGKVLSSEYVSEVGAAIGALDFGSLSVKVRKPFYCAWDFIVKAWPPAVGFKLVL